MERTVAAQPGGFSPLSGPHVDGAYPAALAATCGATLGATVAGLCPLSRYDSPSLALSAAVTDSLFDLPSTAMLNSAQQQLSTDMLGHWVRFMRTGNPNASGSSTWPAYSRGDDRLLQFVPAASTVTAGFAADHQCAVWTPGA